MQPLQQLYTCNHGLMYRVIFLTLSDPKKPLNLTIDPGGNKETSTWKSNLQYMKGPTSPLPKKKTSEMMPHDLGRGCEKKTSKRSKQKKHEKVICSR